MRLTAIDPVGNEQIVAHLSVNDFFGAIDILRPGEPRQTSAAAVSDVNVLIVDDEIVRALIERYPSFAMELHYFVEERIKVVDAYSLNRYDRRMDMITNGYDHRTDLIND